MLLLGEKLNGSQSKRDYGAGRSPLRAASKKIFSKNREWPFLERKPATRADFNVRVYSVRLNTGHVRIKKARFRFVVEKVCGAVLVKFADYQFLWSRDELYGIVFKTGGNLDENDQSPIQHGSRESWRIMEKRIRVKDLAPFASIEDLSDERESPLDGDKPKTTLANIEEETRTSKACTTSTGSTSATTNNSPAIKMNLNVTSTTPRIDISRASSSSHHDDSSPERELILGKAKDSKLEVVFGEEIASELHSSTEELSFHENEDPEKNRSKKSSSHVVSITDMQREALRKDSGCSADVAFLSISGRTSRVSSVGSVASGGSGVSNISAFSHNSAASCLSAVSNLSRGSSPHRTSVETSFCGKKPMHSASVDDEYATIVSKQTRSPSIPAKTRTPSSRTSDQPPEAKHQKSQTARKGRSKPGRKRPTIENPKTQKFVSLYSDDEDKSAAADVTGAKAETPTTQSQPKGAKTLPGLDPRTQVYIPLRSDSVEEKTASSPRKKQMEPTCQPNPFSPKRMKPFTNATLVSFISKYDALKDSPTISLPRRKMYEEFQKFISLRDDDDLGAGARGAKHQSKVERITVPVQVHRSRSLGENMTCTAVIEDTAQLSKSDTRIPAPTSPTPPANARQSSLRLSDSLLEQRHCDSSETKPMDRCHSALATTASSSFSYSSSVAPSQSPSQFLQLDHRGTRPAKSMTHLSTSSKYNSSNSPTINVCAASNTKSKSARSDEYPFRRCSESAKEMRNMDTMKSRSGSIRSLLRTFFKKNGDPKTEKTYHTDSAVEIDFKPIQVPQKSRTCSTAESIIIPLHSPDYDYEAAAAAAVAKKSSRNNDKKGKQKDVTGKAVAVVDLSSREEKEPPDLPPKVVSKALVHRVSTTEMSAATPEAGEGLKTSERIECVAKTTVVQCHVPSSPVSSSCVSQQHLPHISQRCSSPMTEAFSRNHVQKSAAIPVNSYGENSGEVFLPTVESYSSLSSTSKKANEEETDEAMSTDSDKSHPVVHEHDEEFKKLVNQEESFEELPYVPTTLPIERSVAVPIIPIKERSSNDMLVHSVERPRSMSCHMTSLNLNTPSAVTTTVIDRASTSEKLHITLPRTDAVLSSPKWKRRNSERCESSSPPPPLPPRKTTKSASWICFDETRQLESRQSPRRITTLPSSYGTDQSNRSAGVNLTSFTTISASSSSTVEGGYTSSINLNQRIVFVNPNECSCECHDVGGANTASPSRNTIPVKNGNLHHR